MVQVININQYNTVTITSNAPADGGDSVGLISPLKTAFFVYGSINNPSSWTMITSM
jgi:hypothetical protein